jgi:heavy metal efflux system protein
MIHAVIDLSVKNRAFVLGGVLGFIALGLWSMSEVRFDAFPDLTNVQVQVLTASPGMEPQEVERLVTWPIERALGGVPGMKQVRSLSRTGVSAVTVVFEDGTDIWRARQLVKERIDAARAEIPDTAGAPEIAPPTTGLGEVYQFALSSDRHEPYELDRIYQQHVVARLRSVPGVVGVNAWGGGAPQLNLKLDPFKMASYGLTLEAVKDKAARALGMVSGGALVAGGEQVLVRATANPMTPAELSAVEVKHTGRGAVTLGDLGEVEEGAALTVGLGSANGEGEALFVMVQLMAGADALEVVRDVRVKLDEVKAGLPEGVTVTPVYDREALVSSTLETVTRSLIEGGLLVVVVLFLLLGDWRAGLVVASVIPMSLLGAFMGLHWLGYSGNLMSLGAIDFGIIVDSAIVVVEAVVALHVSQSKAWRDAVGEQTQKVAKPVLFAVGIMLLVYVPVLMMAGTEGKLFRPMALTVLMALFTALVLSLTYVPALATLLIKPKGDHQPLLARALRALYAPVLRLSLRAPWLSVVVSLTMLGFSGWALTKMGVEFVPRLEEGDMVVQTARLPSISPSQALEENMRIEQVLRSFPEVEAVASRTGSPALATDPMGLEESDILVKLRPRDTWTTAADTAGLSDAIAKQVEALAPGAELNFTQPIEMRFNELLEGITSDVGVKIYGEDLATLNAKAHEVAAVLATIAGAADVVAPTQEGILGVDVEVRPEALARYGLSAAEVTALVEGVQRGAAVGHVVRGAWRDPVVAKLMMPPNVQLRDLPVVLPSGLSVPLSEVAEIKETLKPVIVKREQGSRFALVRANVRGRDVGGFVREAQDKLASLSLPSGYWVEWSGKYEQIKEATSRLMITLPLILLAIIGVLYVAFRRWGLVVLISLNVPVAVSGGLLALYWRGLPISMSAIVGFIALFGIAVMNGIVLLSRTAELDEGDSFAAAEASALERLRPVLMTALTDAIGFLPMAIAVGVGAEVQRPLATVVMGGLVTSTFLTLLALPALYSAFFKRPPPSAAPAGSDPSPPSGDGDEVSPFDEATAADVDEALAPPQAIGATLQPA